MFRIKLGARPALILGLVYAFAAARPGAPDLILFNGKIFTSDAAHPYVQALAYAEFAEKEKGSLVPGRLADLAALSQDIFTVPAPDLPKTESILTLVGGKVIYDGRVLSAVGVRPREQLSKYRGIARNLRDLRQ